MFVATCFLLVGCTNNEDTPLVSENSFFFQGSSQVEYECEYSFFDESGKQDVILKIEEVDKGKFGEIYTLKIENTDFDFSRINDFYFYVEKDKIYKTYFMSETLPDAFDVLLMDGKLPIDTSNIICCDEEIGDTLEEGKMGWHEYVKVDGNKREYGHYNDSGATTYYEYFIWEENRGIIEYSSGYGGGRDSIILRIKEVK